MAVTVAESDREIGKLHLRISRGSDVKSLDSSARSTAACLEPSFISDSLIRVTNVRAPHNGHVRILELNRPLARNAISKALLCHLHSELSAILRQYDANTGAERDDMAPLPDGPTRAVILASADDRCFCAGADLKERLRFTAEETQAFLAELRRTLQTIQDLPVPVVAAVAGPALGGGFELALAAHLRVLSSTAELALPETRLGIIPGAGGTWRLAALVGRARARDIVLTGRRVGAQEAAALGVASRVVEVDEAQPQATTRCEVLREAVELAREICQGGPVAVRMALRALQSPSAEAEAEAYQTLLGTCDRDEALKAFAEKRKPVFKGR